MGSQAPLTLVQLARKRLLREEALVISALEDLPVGLFPGIFEEAFIERRTNVLRAMVAAWPFPCLPAGAMVEKPHLEILNALLDGLDMLITEMLHPSFTNRRSKLRLLSLIHDCGSIRTKTHECDFSSQAMKQKEPREICPKSGLKKPFMVLTDLKLTKAGFNRWDTYLLHWFQQHKSSVHLCCRKLFMSHSSVFFALKTFNVIHLECLTHLVLRKWSLESMAHLIPYLGQMRNLHTLVLIAIEKPFRYNESIEQEWIRMLFVQIYSLPCLKNLHLIRLDFLTGSLEKWLRYMTMPLESLLISNCQFSQSDLDSLSQRLNICELRYLDLSNMNLSNLYPKPLEVLLQRITSTLKILILEECEIGDTHFNAILPALSQCSQLTKVNFYLNTISLLTLKNLLRHTAKLRKLTQELYPAPLECYEEFVVIIDKFQELCPLLMNIIKAQRQPKDVTFATRSSLKCPVTYAYDLENGFHICE